jgi:hypothetical protein
MKSINKLNKSHWHTNNGKEKLIHAGKMKAPLMGMTRRLENREERLRGYHLNTQCRRRFSHGLLEATTSCFMSAAAFQKNVNRQFF